MGLLKVEVAEEIQDCTEIIQVERRSWKKVETEFLHISIKKNTLKRVAEIVNRYNAQWADDLREELEEILIDAGSQRFVKGWLGKRLRSNT